MARLLKRVEILASAYTDYNGITNGHNWLCQCISTNLDNVYRLKERNRYNPVHEKFFSVAQMGCCTQLVISMVTD